MGDVTVAGVVAPALSAPSWRTRLAVVATVSVAAAALTYVVAVRTGWGQRLDESMKAWWLAERRSWGGEAYAVARLFAAPLLAATSVVSAVVVLARRRGDALPTLVALVLGGPVLVLLLKHQVLPRETLTGGTFPPMNTLPSGHAAVLATAAIVGVWLVPVGRRTAAVVAAASLTAGGGVVILVAALHRPSDVAAAFFVVGAWSSVVLAVAGQPVPVSPPDVRHWRPLAAVAWLLLVAGAVVAGRAVLDGRDADSTSVAVFLGGCSLVAGVGLAVVAAVSWAMGVVGVDRRAEPSQRRS